MSLATKLITLGAFAASALAHGTVSGFLTDGTYNGGYKLDYYYMIQNGQTPPATAGWYAEDLDNGFVQPSSYAAADIICHKNAKPATSTASVKAGGTVEFQWTAWPSSHIGPVITYVANCNGNCSSVDKTALKFVKIDEAGYDVAKKEWAAVAMIATNNTWTTTVPSTLAPGNYVFRHEIIALHGAGSENGAQNYPQCINIEITGSGTENPEGVLGTALYTSTDPGILFNPYTTITSYDIPGPALFGSGSSTGGNTTTPAPASSAAPVSSSTPTPVSSSTPTPTPTVVEAVTPTPTPSASASATATATPASGGDSSLPESFTLDTFITWLQKVGGETSSKARRHARAF